MTGWLWVWAAGAVLPQISGFQRTPLQLTKSAEASVSLSLLVFRVATSGEFVMQKLWQGFVCTLPAHRFVPAALLRCFSSPLS
jgi:hypothetical protein